jgi:hypothetical protein
MASNLLNGLRARLVTTIGEVDKLGEAINSRNAGVEVEEEMDEEEEEEGDEEQ